MHLPGGQVPTLPVEVRVKLGSQRKPVRDLQLPGCFHDLVRLPLPMPQLPTNADPGRDQVDVLIVGVHVPHDQVRMAIRVQPDLPK